MVSKRSLIGISAFVWLIAGFNVLRFGIIEYRGRFSFLILMFTVAVFIPFFIMFQKMVVNNIKRILSMAENKILFLKFFSLKSYIIIAFMMTLGIVLRNMELVPRYFITFFYTGLGTALFSAGLRYLYKLIRFK